MTEEGIAILKSAGTDTEGAMARFCGKIEMYQKFLTKFLDEKCYINLFAALAAGNYDDAILNVHTLKGVSGNLGFMRLMELSASMLGDLRAQKYDNLDAHESAIRTEHDRIVAIIRQIL